MCEKFDEFELFLEEILPKVEKKMIYYSDVHSSKKKNK